jgi:succinate dehydrogenase/fumarate reductase flavoprotein subunit
MLINRLGSNSLLDIVVFGRAAAHRVTETLRPTRATRRCLMLRPTAPSAGSTRSGGRRAGAISRLTPE